MTSLDAIVFDLDGLLIDSEPLWRKAETEVFSALGVDLCEDDCAQTLGLRVDMVVRHWFEHQPWPEADLEAIAETIILRVGELVAERGVAMPGAIEAVHCAANHGLRLALASSSDPRLIEAAVSRLGLRELLPIRLSASDDAEGKPHPAVYLRAVEALELPADRCLAIEDSPAGVASALAAGMPVLAVPSPELAEDPTFDRATHRLDDLLGFAEWLKGLG